jgi:hypothetical protein
MIQLIDSISNPVVILYNIGVIVVFFLWIYREKVPLKKIVNNGKLEYWIIFSVFWFIFSVFANIYFLPSDVDDAIISGTKAFVLNGANPYSENVVVHLLDHQEVLGLYHYFPSDLLVYSIIFIVLSPIDTLFPFMVNSWFIIGNFFFLCLGYLFVRKILLDVADKRLIPVYIFVTSFFMFSNSALLVLYFVIGFYLIKRLSRYNTGITSYILAAGVKYITGLLLFVQISEELVKIRKISEIKLLIPYFIGSFVFFILILPFGVYNVLNATFLYQIEVNARSQVAGIYGPILIEFVLIFNLLEYYTIIFLIATIISIYIAFKFGKSTYERQMILSFLFMMILPFYGTELTIVPLLLWMFQLFDVELNYPESSSIKK